MISRLGLLAPLVFAISPALGQEACEQNDAGLSNQMGKNIVTDNARTAEDFLNESLHHFYTSIEGHLDLTGLVTDLSIKQWGAIFFWISTTIEYSYVACNDIGQCAQGRIVSHYSKLPSHAATDATNSVLDFLTGGELSFGQVFSTGFIRNEFSITTGDGDSHSIDVVDRTPREIANSPEKYPVRPDNDPLVTDKRCRNNFGELLAGQPAQPLSGGGTSPPEPPGAPGYWIRVQIGWHCYPDATGIVCRRIYGYEWVEW